MLDAVIVSDAGGFRSCGRQSLLRIRVCSDGCGRCLPLLAPSPPFPGIPPLVPESRFRPHTSSG
ncbi:hypothetical protein BDY21DRAFT_343770 [Lineolata rhizophorae]|uniref:Uncharacterized protein n=1 Tax=Lineolata rhizophorae TaxID=578093 RepID=A0A6A6P0Z9_9PEZI|nr:hypothetical protein BDY21DRAFT_343770 [Lineolata rhizophorae]